MLLPYLSGTFLSHILTEAGKIYPHQLLLVTGCYHNEIMGYLGQDACKVVFNKNWAQGIAGSIKIGMETMLQADPETEAVMVLVSDQPYINASLLVSMLLKAEESAKGIIAAAYAGISGTPVLFKKGYFNQLQKLQGDKGAKSILQLAVTDIENIDFPLGAVDIDTPDDYNKYIAQT